MIIGAGLQIEGGKFREIANTYRKMQDTGVFSDQEVQRHRTNLDPEYTALEIAASNQIE